MAATDDSAVCKHAMAIFCLSALSFSSLGSAAWVDVYIDAYAERTVCASGEPWTDVCPSRQDPEVGLVDARSLRGWSGAPKTWKISATRDIFWSDPVFLNVPSYWAGYDWSLELDAGRDIIVDARFAQGPAEVTLQAGGFIGAIVSQTPTPADDTNKTTIIVKRQNEENFPFVAIENRSPSQIDIQYDAVVAIDAGHGKLEHTNGTYKYQRTPELVTLNRKRKSLREDEVTLLIAKKVRALLKAEGIKVRMIRKRAEAPFDHEVEDRTNCPNRAGPVGYYTCPEEVKKRREWVEEKDADLILSLHTNRSIDPTTHGTLAFIENKRGGKAFPDKVIKASRKVAKQLLDALATDIGFKKIRNGPVIAGETVFRGGSKIYSKSIPTVLLELGFHTHSVPPNMPLGRKLTDQQLLMFRQNKIAKSIATAIIDSLKSGFY